MSVTPQSRELILQLKNVKDTMELSCPQIHALATAQGYNISLATVKRVFSKGSEDSGFNYSDTLKPLSAVLLEKAETAEANEDGSIEIETYKKLGAYKDRLIEQLSEQVAATGAASNREADAANMQIEYIKGMLAARDAQLRSAEHKVAFLVILTFGLLALIIIALVVDRMDPNSGFFWRQISAIVGGGSQTASVGSLDTPAALMRAILR